MEEDDARAGPAAGILTIPLSFLLDFLWPTMPFMNRTGIVFWICMTTAVAVSLVTKPETEERLKGLIWNKESLVLPKEQRAQMRRLAESDALGGDRQCAADLVVYPVSLTGLGSPQVALAGPEIHESKIQFPLTLTLTLSRRERGRLP